MLAAMAEPQIARAAGSSRWLVAPECHRFNQLCLRPLMRLFSCAIPTESSLRAIVALGMGVVELGCGSGYWTRLLRARGVDVLAYDLHPPANAAEADDNTQDSSEIFGRAWVSDVRRGGPVRRAPAVRPRRALPKLLRLRLHVPAMQSVHHRRRAAAAARAPEPKKDLGAAVRVADRVYSTCIVTHTQ